MGSHAQLPDGRRLHRNAEDIIGASPDHQLRHHGHPQSAAHHADHGFVIHTGNPGVQLHSHRIQSSFHVIVELAVGHDEFLIRVFLQGEHLPPTQGVVPGQNGIHSFMIQRDPIAAAVVLTAGKDHIGPAVFQKLKRLQGMVHHTQVHVHLRADPSEPVEYFRHPLHGDAGIGRDTDDLRFLLGDDLDLVFQVGIGLQKFPDGRHKLHTLFRKLNAVVIALQKRESDLPLQSIHHVGQAGLGVAHHFGSLCKAAQVRSRHEDFQFLAVHIIRSICSLLHFLIPLL